MSADPHSNEAGVSSPVSFALAQLDHSIRAVEEQLEALRAGLGFDEEELRQSLTTCVQHSTTVCDLIRAERPDASWEDRNALDGLVQQLEMAAAARRNQQRRSRLVELANELDAGTIKHRLEARTAALNNLRLQAVKELRSEAAFSEQTKVLPGPSAQLWLRWACNLNEEKDADALATLHQDFVALERFTGEMDESYWTPAQRAQEDAEHAAEPPIRPLIAPSVPPAAASAKPAPAGTSTDKPSADVREQVVSAIHNGNYKEAISLCYEPGASEAAAKVETAAEASASETGSSAIEAEAAPTVASAASASPAKTASRTKRRGRDRKSHWVETGMGASATAKAQTVAPERQSAASAEPAALKAVEPSNGAGGGEPAAMPAEAAAEELIEPAGATAGGEPFATLTAAAESRKPAIAWAAAAAFVVLSAIIFAVIYHLHSNTSAKAGEPVSAAATNAGAAASTEAPVLLNKQPAEGAQNKILLTVEHCGHGSAGNAECWGYVSNQGNDSSKVSLNRADVVDGKGNSFSVEHNQLAFASGQTSTIPAGSRAKYTVSIPEKDKDARTLTLYIDLSSPRGLEYTFRDVPVVE